MKKSTVIVGISFVIISLGVVLFAYFSVGSGTPTAPVVTTDSQVAKITFNEDALVDRGVTRAQLDLLEQALGQYFDSQDIKPSQIDFDSIQRKPTDPKMSTPFSEISFLVQLDNGSIYKAKMDSYGSSGGIRLYLYSMNDELLYDSQNIGGSSG